MLNTKSRSVAQRRRAQSGRRLIVKVAGKPRRRATPHPNPKVVKQAEKIFAGMGMTPAEAIALFYKQTALHDAFPITELIPNEETQAAILDARAGIGLIRGRSVAEMLREAEVDDCVN